VTLPASLEGRERARLFCALRLPDAALDVLSTWQEAHIRSGRPVLREQLHITLAFLGHRPVEELESILGALRESAAAAGAIRLVPERYRETRSVGMLALKDLSGGAEPLADGLQRFRKRPRLQPPLPELGDVVPSDAAVYLSQLRPSAAEYFVVESFVLGG
jgi:hypothetical protein